MASTARGVDMFLCSYLDEDVQGMFLPLNLMQALSLNPKYRIQNNFVYPNDRTSNIISLCGLVIFVSLDLYRMSAMLFDENMQRYQTVNFLYFATVFDSLFYLSGFVLNFVIHFVHSKDNVKFILTFQKVHRFIQNFASTKLVVRRNWFNVILLFVFYIVTCVYVDIVYSHPPWYIICYLFILGSMDCNIVYAICLIKLLTEKVVQWNAKVILSLSNGGHVLRCNKMGHAYVEILECYNIYKKVFQLSVLFHTAETIFLVLIKVQVLIEFLHFYSRNPYYGIVIVQGLLYALILKCLVIQFVLCYYTHAFYDAMKISQDSCLLILASYCTDEKRRLCKNIQRIHRASYGNMSACGLFYIDISHPVSVMALLTNYTIVLLQFALL